MDPNEEIGTWSGIVAPTDVQDADKELQDLLKKFEKKTGVVPSKDGKLAELPFPCGNNERPQRELSVKGFFTMAYPYIFVNGFCDITVPSYRNLKEDFFD